jgi:4-hydroxy-tetrahydrodipicolinate synthase
MVLGIGGNNTKQVVEKFDYYDMSDIDAILSVSPNYNKPTQEGIYQHYRAIGQATDKPIILYNVPGRTGSNVCAETTIRMAHDFKNVIGIKEASGDLVQIMNIIKNTPDDFLMISGDDVLALPTISVGGAGVISVIGQAYPSLFSEMIREGLKGNFKNAYQTHYKLMECVDLIFREGNPAGIKSLLNNLDICSSIVRLPLVAVTKGLKEKINNFNFQLKEEYQKQV